MRSNAIYSRPAYAALNVRWEFRKARTRKETEALPGTIYAIIRVGKEKYGPYSTETIATRELFDLAKSKSADELTGDAAKLRCQLDAFKADIEAAADRLLQRNLPLTGPLLLEHRIPKAEMKPMTITEGVKWFLDWIFHSM